MENLKIRKLSYNYQQQSNGFMCWFGNIVKSEFYAVADPIVATVLVTK